MAMPPVNKMPMPEMLYGQFPDQSPQVGMNGKAFEQLIRAHGVRMIQLRPLPCPNQRSLNGGDHDPNCNLCYNGYIYYGRTEFIGAFMGNSINKNYGLSGTWDKDGAQVIVPSKDINNNEMDFQMGDQLIMPDHTVRFPQRVQHNQTGIDRLHFPAIDVDVIMDSSGQEYAKNVDYKVDENGMIKWLTQNRPGYDLDLNAGMVYSIAYYTRPYLSIQSMPHQLRTTQTQLPDGTTVQERFPQLVLVQKNFIPYNDGDEVGQGSTPEPQDGSLGVTSA